MVKEKTLGECCPLFHAEKWDEKIFDWKNKQFIKASVPTLFHIPFPPMIARRINKMMQLSEEADRLLENKEDILLLWRDPHPFKSEMYLSVTGEVPEAKNTTVSGNFTSKVYKGNYNEVPKFMQQMKSFLAEQGKEAKDCYVHYAYCPKCAQDAGHNYVVLFAKVNGDE